MNEEKKSRLKTIGVQAYGFYKQAERIIFGYGREANLPVDRLMELGQEASQKAAVETDRLKLKYGKGFIGKATESEITHVLELVAKSGAYAYLAAMLAADKTTD